MANKKQAGRERSAASSDPLLAVIAVQLRGVMGRQPQAHDVELVDNYERDVAACEDAIRKAQAELDAAGEGPDPKENAFELAWAWHGLSEAYQRLATVKARAKLARRRTQLEEAARQKEKRAV